MKDCNARIEGLLRLLDDRAIVEVVEDRIERWSPGAHAMYGYEPSEVIGRLTGEVFGLDEIQSARTSGGLIDCWQRGKDGTQFPARLQVAPFTDGDVNGLHVVVRPQEERLPDTGEDYRTLTSTVGDYGILMLDTNGFVKTWNRGAELIIGYRPDEIIGKHFSVFYPAAALEAQLDQRELAEALRNGRFEDEGWRVRRDGSQFWANVIVTPLRNRAGEHIGYTKITRDLSERREAEDDRVRLAKAEEAVRLRDEFLSIASHELRTPLVALQLQLDSMRLQGGLDPKQQTKAERAARSVQRLSDLIAALLDISRIAAGRLTLSLGETSLDAVVRDAVDRLEEVAVAAGCPITTSIEPNLIGTFDAVRIGQVVSNLLSNAFKYAAKTPVSVALERNGTEALLTVEDRGPGIPDAKLERVFERFERAASRNFGGMGIGLYVAKQIVLGHGGTIKARNRDGGGTRLEIRLPVRDTH